MSGEVIWQYLCYEKVEEIGDAQQRPGGILLPLPSLASHAF